MTEDEKYLYPVLIRKLKNTMMRWNPNINIDPLEQTEITFNFLALNYIDIDDTREEEFIIFVSKETHEDLKKNTKMFAITYHVSNITGSVNGWSSAIDLKEETRNELLTILMQSEKSEYKKWVKW